MPVTWAAVMGFARMLEMELPEAADDVALGATVVLAAGVFCAVPADACMLAASVIFYCPRV